MELYRYIQGVPGKSNHLDNYGGYKKYLYILLLHILR